MTSADLRPARPPRDRRQRRGGAAGAPVFLDRTGRRRRLVLAAGLACAAVLLTGMALLTVGLFSGAPLPLPGWPEPADPGRGEIGAGHLGASPTPVAGEGDRRGPAETPSARPPAAPPGSPTAPPQGPTVAPTSDKPGLGYERRASPNPNKPPKPPGRPE
jgi:hypothetical protein